MIVVNLGLDAVFWQQPVKHSLQVLVPEPLALVFSICSAVAQSLRNCLLEKLANLQSDIYTSSVLA